VAIAKSIARPPNMQTKANTKNNGPIRGERTAITKNGTRMTPRQVTILILFGDLLLNEYPIIPSKTKQKITVAIISIEIH
jgi:hypothetical protein